jgi:TM2 domain-containing membrane protein YozV
MAKIIRIKGDVVSVGSENGSFFDVNRNELDFKPVVGQNVDVYTTNNQVIVTKSAVDVAAPVAGSVVSSSPVRVQVVNQYVSGHVVNQAAFAILAIFLGSFGIHRFYAGKVVSGIFYLLFCWTFIPGIIAFVEGIICLTKTADANGNVVV